MGGLIYKTQFGWDDEAKVWVAVCDDPSFALEDESIVALAKRVEDVIPELLIDEGTPEDCATGENEREAAPKIVRIRFDYDVGPIWTDIFDAKNGKHLTGIKVIDDDKVLSILNAVAQEEYASLYFFDETGVYFDSEKYEEMKAYLLSLIQLIVLRINELNDGSFIVIDEETPKLRGK